ncbi:adenine-specific DNA-methyltransferase [Acetivibrio cellulolyticus]|uniref:adenine-specific DNA-methyltransferase n=1 Tax=Acetivibrio cellulolyticus TaxID=35830 RepID=UPI0001E2D183|nr:adenine-specific DNA-methyltransferase [Acetivibrio cellulolyticus]
MEQLFCKLNFPYTCNTGSMVINGDCMSVLPYLKEKTIDLIFADPPYNLGKDFGNDSDNWKNKSEYLHWCYAWIDECFRVLKDNGTIYIMNSTQNISYIDVYLREKYNVINNIVWYYDSSGVQSKYKYGSLYEPVIMANKSAKARYTFNWENIKVEARTGAVRKLIDYRKTPPQPYNNEKVPGNVWEFSRVRYRMSEYENHPSQKPEILLERIVKASSNPDEIVLDPFSGTFTTAVVANRLGRKSIGIELNDCYYGIGLRRVLGLSE